MDWKRGATVCLNNSQLFRRVYFVNNFINITTTEQPMATKAQRQLNKRAISEAYNWNEWKLLVA